MIAKVLIAAAFVTLLALAALGGFAGSLALYGDYIPAREGSMCAALNVPGGRAAERWAVSKDGRCHMALFLWHRLGSAL